MREPHFVCAIVQASSILFEEQYTNVRDQKPYVKGAQRLSVQTFLNAYFTV